MDNERFNITGDSLDELRDVLELIFKREFAWPKVGSYGYFTGYAVDRHVGFVLFRHPIDQADTTVTKFPFDEGRNPSRLATFIQNYLSSDKAKVEDFPQSGDPNYDQYRGCRYDLEWDRAVDHDGSNGPAWRVFKGDWGHVPRFGGGASYAVRPIVAWYGK